MQLMSIRIELLWFCIRLCAGVSVYIRGCLLRCQSDTHRRRTPAVASCNQTAKMFPTLWEGYNNESSGPVAEAWKYVFLSIFDFHY